ncbi:hypothetical protein MUO79_01805 [Candidatus Bathyarchaeota archaeon]|nr:hypothetical protein [Candidatus Bathyarchaeota archaeon]
MSSDVDEKLDEAEREYRKKHPELNVVIDTKNVETILKKLAETETELENEKTLREDYESKLQLVAEQKLAEKRAIIISKGYKGNLDSLEAVISAEQHLGLRKEDSGKGAKGEVNLRPQDLGGSGQKEYDSVESMIDDLRKKARLDPNSLEATQLKQLFTKVLSGMRSQPQKTMGFEYEGKDSLKQLLDRQNREYRRKHGYVEKEGET